MVSKPSYNLEQLKISDTSRKNNKKHKIICIEYFWTSKYSSTVLSPIIINFGSRLQQSFNMVTKDSINRLNFNGSQCHCIEKVVGVGSQICSGLFCISSSILGISEAHFFS